jgi:hypothetical protein
MEIISIEKKTFEELVSRLGQFVERMDSINRQRNGRRMSEWMDNQDVCQALKISPRTLQTLRDSGRLPHSKINNRIYYRPEDVERLIENEAMLWTISKLIGVAVHFPALSKISIGFIQGSKHSVSLIREIFSIMPCALVRRCHSEDFLKFNHLVAIVNCLFYRNIFGHIVYQSLINDWQVITQIGKFHYIASFSL